MIEPVKIEVKGITDKEEFCRLLSQKFNVPVVYEKKGKVMTTNFEWLYENDRETLIIMTSGDCDKCKYDSDCAKAFCRCERKWLEAEYEEYVEPDSWEKITNDALLNPEEYCVENGIHYYDREEAEMLKASSLVFRCKDMCDLLMKEE